MIVSYVVIVFIFTQNATDWVYSLVHRRGYFSPQHSGQSILKAKKAPSQPSYLFINKGATQKTQYLELISYPDQALWLPMTRSFPSVPCFFAGLIPFTQNALRLSPFIAQNSRWTQLVSASFPRSNLGSPNLGPSDNFMDSK